MNVLDSLKDFFMPADDNEPEAPNMTAPEEEPAAASTATASSSYSNAGYTRTSSYDDRKNNERYATIKATAQFQVVLVKATAYTSDSKKVADYLMAEQDGCSEPGRNRRAGQAPHHRLCCWRSLRNARSHQAHRKPDISDHSAECRL